MARLDCCRLDLHSATSLALVHGLNIWGIYIYESTLAVGRLTDRHACLNPSEAAAVVVPPPKPPHVSLLAPHIVSADVSEVATEVALTSAAPCHCYVLFCLYFFAVFLF